MIPNINSVDDQLPEEYNSDDENVALENADQISPKYGEYLEISLANLARYTGEDLKQSDDVVHFLCKKSREREFWKQISDIGLERLINLLITPVDVREDGTEILFLHYFFDPRHNVFYEFYYDFHLLVDCLQNERFITILYSNFEYTKKFFEATLDVLYATVNFNDGEKNICLTSFINNCDQILLTNPELLNLFIRKISANPTPKSTSILFNLLNCSDSDECKIFIDKILEAPEFLAQLLEDRELLKQFIQALFDVSDKETLYTPAFLICSQSENHNLFYNLLTNPMVIEILDEDSELAKKMVQALFINVLEDEPEVNSILQIMLRELDTKSLDFFTFILNNEFFYRLIVESGEMQHQIANSLLKFTNSFCDKIFKPENTAFNLLLQSEKGIEILKFFMHQEIFIKSFVLAAFYIMVNDKSEGAIAINYFLKYLDDDLILSCIRYNVDNLKILTEALMMEFIGIGKDKEINIRSIAFFKLINNEQGLKFIEKIFFDEAIFAKLFADNDFYQYFLKFLHTNFKVGDGRGYTTLFKIWCKKSSNAKVIEDKYNFANEDIHYAASKRTASTKDICGELSENEDLNQTKLPKKKSIYVPKAKRFGNFWGNAYSLWGPPKYREFEIRNCRGFRQSKSRLMMPQHR